MMHAMKRAALAIGLLMGAPVLGGCAVTPYQDTQGSSIAFRSYRPEPQTSRHRESYLQVRGKGREQPRFGFVRLGYELFAPWKTGFTMGGFDTRRLEQSVDQQGCVEFDVPESNPLQFAALCGFKTSLTGN